jgi:phage terminase large subunit GpA-like protein
MAEFSLDVSDPQKAAHQFVRFKPNGLLFIPTTTSYLVTYKLQGEKFYLNYVRIELKFKCDWKRKWFKNNYTIVSEVAITDRHEDNIVRFSNQESFKSNMVFADKVQAFADNNFWGDYNIIEPEESIQIAIKKIAKSLQK